MKWLVALLVMGAAFATSVRVLDTELGYVDVSGVKLAGEVYELETLSPVIKAVATREFVAENYSVRVNPRNIERLAIEMGFPLSGDLGVVVHPGKVEQTAELPEIACGNYRIDGEAYYTVNGTLKRFQDTVHVRLPCRDLKSRIVFGLLSRLPYPVLRAIAGWFGFL